MIQLAASQANHQVGPSDKCNSRTSGGTPGATDARGALLTWLRSCPPAELRQALARLPFKRLQQLHELHDFDPPADDKASLALSQEARTAVLADRAARGLSLWNRGDLIHRAELQLDALARVGRVVTRRRNGSIAVGALKRVDKADKPDDDQWNTAAELAADRAAMNAANPAATTATNTRERSNEDGHTVPGGATPASQAGNVDRR